MPPEVEEARNHARRIPQVLRNTWIPSSSITVASLLANSSTSVPLITPMAEFSLDSPNILLDATISSDTPLPNELQVLPSPPDLQQLRLSFNDAWLAGARSITLTSYPTLRFPLWMERLLGELSVVDFLRRSWSRSLSWLVPYTKRPNRVAQELSRKCQDRLERLPFNEHVRGQAGNSILQTRDLTLLLGPHWLDDEVLNAGCDWVMQQSPHSGDTSLVLSSHYINSISNRVTDHDIPFHLRKKSVIEQRIATGSISFIFIPINIENRHWTLVKVDCATSTLAYGDSLDERATIPPAIRTLLLHWLTDLLPQARFTDAPLIVPQQQDGHSCGVIVMTEIAHHCLGLPSFEPKQPESVRMEWFLRLSACYGADEADSDEEIGFEPDVDGASIWEDDFDGMDIEDTCVEVG